MPLKRISKNSKKWAHNGKGKNIKFKRQIGRWALALNTASNQRNLLQKQEHLVKLNGSTFVRFFAEPLSSSNSNLKWNLCVMLQYSVGGNAPILECGAQISVEANHWSGPSINRFYQLKAGRKYVLCTVGLEFYTFLMSFDGHLNFDMLKIIVNCKFD